MQRLQNGILMNLYTLVTFDIGCTDLTCADLWVKLCVMRCRSIPHGMLAGLQNRGWTCFPVQSSYCCWHALLSMLQFSFRLHLLFAVCMDYLGLMHAGLC